MTLLAACLNNVIIYLSWVCLSVSIIKKKCYLLREKIVDIFSLFSQLSRLTVSFSMPARSGISEESEMPTKGKLFHIFWQNDRTILYWHWFQAETSQVIWWNSILMFGLGGKLNIKGFNNLWNEMVFILSVLLQWICQWHKLNL